MKLVLLWYNPTSFLLKIMLCSYANWNFSSVYNFHKKTKEVCTDRIDLGLTFIRRLG